MIAALDVGGTHVSGALVDPSTWLVAPGSWRNVPLDSSGSHDEILATFTECLHQLVAQEAQLSTTLGVSMPGPFDYDKGIGLFAGVAKFESLFGVDVGRALLDEFEAFEQVRFINDAQAWVLGEWLSGAAKGFDRVVGITLGTGVGSGFLADGALVTSGDLVPPDASVYRLQINGRPLEETVSRRALIRAYTQAAGVGDLDVYEITERARAGDQLAAQVLNHAFSALGTALLPWVDRFAADVIVVGGSISHSWDLVQPALTSTLGPKAALLRQSTLFDDAAMIGAAHAAAS